MPMSDNYAYSSWKSMKQRCNNQNDPAYKYYGGRGISYDSRWESFQKFLEDVGERPRCMTLDRIDNNKGYCKDNCRWADSETQANNKNEYKVKRKVRSDSSSKVTGVAWDSAAGWWRAYYCRGQKRVHLHRGYDFFEAVCRRKSWEIKEAQQREGANFGK